MIFLTMIQKFQLPITCNHTPIYDSERGEMVCTSCGEVLIEREQMPYIKSKDILIDQSKTSNYHYPSNTQSESAKIHFDKTKRLIRKYDIFMDTTILTLSIRKIRIFLKYIDISESMTDTIINDLLYYYKKIPKDLICKKFIKGVNKYRCYEYLFVLFYYLNVIKHMGIEDYLGIIESEGFILRMSRFNNIAILLKHKAPELIKNRIVFTQFDRSKMINVRVMKTLQEIVNRVDYSHIKSSKNIIPIMIHEITVDTNKSEIENWREYLLKKSGEIMSKINFSNVKMHLNSICSGLIYVSAKGTMTKKKISVVCELSELTTSQTTNKFENFIRKKYPSLL